MVGKVAAVLWTVLWLFLLLTAGVIGWQTVALGWLGGILAIAALKYIFADAPEPAEEPAREERRERVEPARL